MPFPLAILLAACTSVGPIAQPAIDRLQVGDLERVEGQVEDLSALSGAGRIMPAALGVPIGFNGVFRVPESASTRYAGWFARVSGGVIAVFPASEYHWDKDKGVFAVIPSSTQYLIGGIPVGADPIKPAPPHTAASLPLTTSVSTLRNTRLDTSVHPARPGDRVVLPSQKVEPVTTAARVAQRTERMILDDRYRAARVTTLLERATEQQ